MLVFLLELTGHDLTLWLEIWHLTYPLIRTSTPNKSLNAKRGLVKSETSLDGLLDEGFINGGA